jgi:hypothetical protein
MQNDSGRVYKQLEVALFSNNKRLIQTFSMLCRKFNMLVPYFREASDLIKHINLTQCNLLFIDTEALKNVERFLVEHPRFLNKDLILIGLGQNIQSKILQTTLQEVPSSQTLEATLNWGELFFEMKVQNRSSERELSLIKNDFEQSFESVQENKIISEQWRNVSQMIQVLEKLKPKTKRDFLENLASRLDSWRGLKASSFYELNPAGDQLTSIKFKGEKNRKLPTIGLGKKCENGIEYFVQEMAYQVAFEELGRNTIAIIIEGIQKHPDVVCFLSFNENHFESINKRYNWSIFEGLLSNLYKKIMARELDDSETEVQSQFVPVWEFFKTMDLGIENQVFLGIDLQNLNRFISQKTKVQFEWSSFFNDLLIKVASRLSKESLVTTFGSQYILIAEKRSLAKKLHLELDLFLKDFDYWQYFLETKMIFTKNLYPKTIFVAASSTFFLKNHVFNQEQKSNNEMGEKLFKTQDFSRKNRLQP